MVHVVANDEYVGLSIKRALETMASGTIQKPPRTPEKPSVHNMQRTDTALMHDAEDLGYLHLERGEELR